MFPDIKKDKLFWIFFVFLGFSLGTYIITRDAKNGFGTVSFGRVKSFVLLNQYNKKIESKFISGKVWVGNFISNQSSINKSDFILKAYSKINKELQFDDIQMITFITDSNFEINKILYQNYNTTFDKWDILIGEESNLLALSPVFHKPENFAFIVDQNDVVRGIYNLNLISDINKLIKDVKKLI